jgi:hypothetical protein
MDGQGEGFFGGVEDDGPLLNFGRSSCETAKGVTPIPVREDHHSGPWGSNLEAVRGAPEIGQGRSEEPCLVESFVKVDMDIHQGMGPSPRCFLCITAGIPGEGVPGLGSAF